MADILIRGMEMPPGCGACPCSIYGECDAIKPRRPLKQYRWSADERPDFCPLAALPEGHGRLVDGSFLEQRCKRQMASEWNAQAKPQSWSSAYEQFLEDVENCATIVPAEEDET